MNRRNLLGMVFGVYWAIVLVVNFHAHAGKELGNMEMMKRLGGQSGYGYCTQRTFCKDLSCLGCTEAQLNGPCTNPPTGQIGYYTETCATDGDLETCLVTRENVQALCIQYYPCNCRAGSNGLPYCQPGAVNNKQCVSIDPGQTCTYTPCN
jgi:hypothetical protein